MASFSAPRIGYLILICSVSVFPDEDASNADGSDALKSETHKAIVAQFREILAKNKVVTQGPKPVVGELVTEPILNWDDIERGHYYGTLWIWGKNGRPTAIVEMFTENLEKKITGWPSNVVHSLSTELVRPEGPGWNWEPEKPGLELKVLPYAPEPAATSKLRRIQMRSLAKRFSSSESSNGRQQLRLLPTAVHLYDSAEDGILDGGIFAFVHGGTNPELILIVEAVEQNQLKSWQYSCVRLGHAPIRLSLDDEEIWSVDQCVNWDPTSPYYCLFRQR